MKFPYMLAGMRNLLPALPLRDDGPMVPRSNTLRKTPSPLGEKVCPLFDWLVTQDLPVSVDSWENINLLRMLLAAGLVKASIPHDYLDAEGSVIQPPATVTALTYDGFRWRKSQGDPTAYSIL